MARSKIKTIHFRRKREGKTDYKRRLKLLLAGKKRIAIRKSLKNTWIQLIEYSPAGDRIVLSAHSKELKKLGWKSGCGNVPAAYLTGFLLGKKAAGKDIGECVPDTGLYQSIKGNRIYAALKGALDAGIKAPASKDVMPGEKRINGAHIAEFAKKVRESKEDYPSQFSAHSPEEITKQFEEVKHKIEGTKNG